MAGTVLLGFCAALVAIAVAGAAEGQVASVVVGLARCADCTRKNMKAETAFKGNLVVISMRAYASVASAMCTTLALATRVVHISISSGVK
jgi:hypothetical protein